MDMNIMTVTLNLRDAAEARYIETYFGNHADSIESYKFTDDDSQVTVTFKWRSHANRFLQWLMPETPLVVKEKEVVKEVVLPVCPVPLPPVPHPVVVPVIPKKHKNWLQVLRDALS